MSFVIGPLRRADAITPTIDQAHENPRADLTIRLSNVHRQRAFHRREVKVRISACRLANCEERELREQK
jgi:hypothetical protein